MKDRHRDETHAAPERALHHQEDADQQKIREIVTRNLLAGIAGHLPELGQLLPDKGHRSQYLQREQQAIQAVLGCAFFVSIQPMISARSAAV